MQPRNAVSRNAACPHDRQHRSAVLLAAQLDKTTWRNIKTGKYGGAKLTDIFGDTLFFKGKLAFLIEHFDQYFDRNGVASLLAPVGGHTSRETLSGFFFFGPKVGSSTPLCYVVTPR